LTRRAAGGTEPDPSLRGDDVPWLRDSSRSLLAQVAWFNRLRLGAVLGMVIVTGGASALALLTDPRPVYALAAITLLVNLGYRAWYPRLAQLSNRRLRRHVYLQIALDLVILTCLLHFSGGVSNPLVLFYLFHSFIAALLLSLRAAVAVAAVSVGLLCALAFGEYYGLLRHRPIGLRLLEFEAVGPLDLVVWIAALVLVLGFSIYFVATIVRQLAARETELKGLSRQLALSEKLASIGTLAAGVSHEINNPVGVIQSKAKILRYRIADGDPPERLLAELDTIEKHTRRIGAITEGLLTFSRETPFELRPVAVNEIVQEGADLVRVPYKAAEVGLTVHLDPGELTVQGSPNHLLQVLVNILLNARDASPAGGSVVLATERRGGEVLVRIADRGVGIPAEVLGKIFDPFFTTKDVDKGTGLGLALSHGIVERHGGRIEVESEAGVGSTFTVVLPVV
jgi:signal transduction histidine kinase